MKACLADETSSEILTSIVTGPGQTQGPKESDRAGRVESERGRIYIRAKRNYPFGSTSVTTLLEFTLQHSIGKAQ